MLQSLTIKNIALIDNLTIDLSTGFNVLTGETGAGKSIIIDSINMTLENDILVRLRNGEDAEMIAQELINNLNSAIATKDKEDAEAKRIAEEKARAEKERRAREEQEKK